MPGNDIKLTSVTLVQVVPLDSWKHIDMYQHVQPMRELQESRTFK